MSGTTESNTATGDGTGDSHRPASVSPSAEATTAQQYRVLAVAAVAALVAGALIAALLFGVPGGSSGDEVDGTVAVVSIEGPIMEPIGDDLEDELQEIRADDSIDAVVLKMDTPGGAPAPTERMYLSIQRTSEEMPVLASVQGMSASAGYYMMLPAEEIYALPTSTIGSVGLAAGAPQATPPQEGPSGPDKRGSNVVHDWAQQEALGDIFIETVMEQRGDRIELDREEVSTAQVYTGVTSVENGFADEIGSLDDAVADAAERAGLEEYSIEQREVGQTGGIPLIVQTEYGLVAIHDENPTIADVEPLQYAMVHEPAVPHIEELQSVSAPAVEDELAELLETEDGGEQP